MSLAALVLLGAVNGVVFDDANANGQRDAGERGLAKVVVSDGSAVVATDAEGRYRIADATSHPVFVVLPGDRRPVAAWYAPPRDPLDFALAPSPVGESWRFAHLSDTHIQPENVERTRRALALAASLKVDLALVSGDLVKDSLRVGEVRARSLFTLYAAEMSKAPFPVRSVVGNHDVFGIERDKSGVSETSASYGKALFEEFLGSRFSAFNHGRLHFIVLDTIGVADTHYYGFLDPAQLDWIGREIALLPVDTPIVTICHIPLRNGGVSMLNEFAGERLKVAGMDGFRHVVRNAPALERILAGRPWTLALQGHFHAAERLRNWDQGAARYHTAPAVDHPGPAEPRSGLFVYSVRGAEVDDGQLLWLDDEAAH